MTHPYPNEPHLPLIDSALTVQHSSSTLGWTNVLVEQTLLRSGELYVAGLAEHMVCLVLDDDYVLEQQRNGTTFVHTFSRGQAQLLPVETSGFWRTRRDVRLLHLQFSSHFLSQVAEESFNLDGAQVELEDRFLMEDAQVMHVGYALLAEMLDGGPNGHAYSSALAHALAIHLLRRYAGARREPERQRRVLRQEIRRVLDYIHDHLSDDITMEDLASAASLSVSHLNAVFRQTMGLAPHRYILHQRVERAKNLLLGSRLSAAEVAAEVGFYDQSHLNRHMRRLLGVTPAALQRQRNVQILR
jgi:AraC family transcriptional regulator